MIKKDSCLKSWWGSRSRLKPPPSHELIVTEAHLQCTRWISDLDWNHAYISGLRRNLFQILRNNPTVVSIMCKGHGCEYGIHVRLIGIDWHRYWFFAVAEVEDANVWMGEDAVKEFIRSFILIPALFLLVFHSWLIRTRVFVAIEAIKLKWLFF